MEYEDLNEISLVIPSAQATSGQFFPKSLRERGFQIGPNLFSKVFGTSMTIIPLNL